MHADRLRLKKYIYGIPPYTTLLLLLVGLLFTTTRPLDCSAGKAPASFSFGTSFSPIHAIGDDNDGTVITASVAHKIVHGHFSRISKLKLKVFDKNALSDVCSLDGMASLANDAAPSSFSPVYNRPGYYLFLFRYTPF